MKQMQHTDRALNNFNQQLGVYRKMIRNTWRLQELTQEDKAYMHLGNVAALQRLVALHAHQVEVGLVTDLTR